MKFRDAIGYGQQVERPESPGVYEDVITERILRGEVLRNTRSLAEGDKVNNDRSIGNRFSLLADTYAAQNFETIRYITWRGRRYLIREIEYVAPRLLITPGGVYNGPTPSPSPDAN